MTKTRAAEIAAFLEGTAWAAAKHDALPMDASFRRYIRLFDMQRGAQALLMDAPPDKETKTPAFIHIAKTLRGAGLSAPEIYKADLERGLLLLEDFGQASFTQVLSTKPGRELELYSAAGGVVTALNGLTDDTAAPYNTAALTTELDVFCDHWWPDAFGADMPEGTRAAFYDAWAQPLAILDRAAKDAPALTLRDFHVDNLFNLPARSGAAQVGLIDFQDALTGHAAYDLVSLLQDARRDVCPDVQTAVLNACDEALQQPHFKGIYAAYGAQRALKILGVFVRLDTLYNKPSYRRHLPRTWSRVMMNLNDPGLGLLADWIETHIPHEHRAG